MTLTRPGRGDLLWVGALVLALVAIVLDSRARLKSIETITARDLGTPAPAADRDSPSGYAWGQHRVILPAIDAYHWILQTEQMLAGGGWRIRHASYDDAPAGREVHWAGDMRWWAATWASIERGMHPELTPAQALERVTPWANTALLAVLLVACTPLLAIGLGPVPAALFALGSVAVFPFFEYFVVGYFDHHGVATMAALLCVLFLVVGGAGWVRTAPIGAGERAWPPVESVARRWHLASAVSGAVSLWVNAATVVPVLGGIGLAVLLAQWCLPAAPATKSQHARAPGLWRLWGLVGGGLGIGFYLLEYFPAHLGARLEINHPLYGLAWAAGGDLLARSAGSDRRPAARAWIGLDLLGVLLVPLLVAVAGARVFRLADPFLLTLHRRFIAEFLPLRGQLLRMGTAAVAGRLSPLPLSGLALPAVLWPTEAAGARRVLWRSALALAAICALAFGYVGSVALLDGRAAIAAVLALLLGGALVVGSASPGARPLAPPVRAGLVLVLVPAALLCALSLSQVRWVGVDAALWLGVLVAAAALLAGDRAYTWSLSRKAVAGGLLALAFVVGPALYLPLPLDQSDPPQEIARDASWWLRRRIGGDSAIVLTSPNATTWMAYYGGFRGIGSLYWENADGLRAATEMVEAPTADSLRGLLAVRGVTHVVLYPWESGFEQLRVSMRGPQAASAHTALADLPYAMTIGGEPDLPAWLMPLPYPGPEDGGYGHPSALLFEVVPDQPRELALVRLAQYYQAIGAPDRTEAALRASLRLRPTVAGLALYAQLAAAQNDQQGFEAAMGRLKQELAAPARLEPADRLNAAIALAVGRDGASAARELERVLAEADERALRRMTPDALAILVQLARQLGLDRAHPDAVRHAESLAGPAGRR